MGSPEYFSFHFSICIILQLLKPEQKLEANVEIREQTWENSSRFSALENYSNFQFLFYFFVTSNIFKLRKTIFILGQHRFCSRGYIILCKNIANGGLQ